MIILDGPVGTELERRGVATSAPLWSAHGLDVPEVLAQIHADYAAAGATVHTACTFRVQPRHFPADFASRVGRAVAIARGAVPADHDVVGSLAPIADCYRPDLSPPPDVARDLHRQMARALADAGVDRILCEAFPSEAELAIAVEEAVGTGLPVWASLTARPDGALLAPAELARGAALARDRGAGVVLVNCVDYTCIDPYVEALAALLGDGTGFGVYANAGTHAGDESAYAAAAARWAERGAGVIGACCGSGPGHIRAVSARLAAAGNGG